MKKRDREMGKLRRGEEIGVCMCVGPEGWEVRNEYMWEQKNENEHAYHYIQNC